MKSLVHNLTLVMAGRSGSGKGTQSLFILKKLGRSARHMETGRFLRALFKKRNITTNRVQKIMEMGNLAPSWFAAFTWLKELIEKGYGDQNWICDGSPRSVWEAKLYDQVMQFHQRPLPLAVYIDVAKKEAERRLLLRGRGDDTPHAIRNRMKFFEKDVTPVLRYYQRRGRLLRVDGNPTPEIVWRSIDRMFTKKLGKLWTR